MVRKGKTARAEQRIQWWKLKKEDCCEDFRERLRQAIGGCERSGRLLGRCLPCHLDRRQMIERLGHEMKKYRRVFRGRGWQGRNGMVKEQKNVNRNTRKCNVRQKGGRKG